ncbi:chloride channel [Aspergillus sp. HF37]|nr:chloride channel [Aspergillus sp. HF37]
MAIVSYAIGIAEGSLFEIKSGFCTARWFLSKKACCPDSSSHACAQWRPWSDILRLAGAKAVWANFAIFALATVSLAALSHAVTSTTASPARATTAGKATRSFAAAGSGLAEVQVIVSGVALPGYLTLRTLAAKTLALLLSISSGMCIGKEGPFVHIAACLGNLSCEFFSVHEAGRGRRIVGASIAAGVTVAFRAPISGTLFAFEVAGDHLPLEMLFATFFGAIAAALCSEMLNTYWSEATLHPVGRLQGWKWTEMPVFVALGAMGGATGSLFIKSTKAWKRYFRQIPVVKQSAMLEVVLVGGATAALNFWNPYTKLPVTELLLQLGAPGAEGIDPFPTGPVLVAALIKCALTVVSHGIQVPAGIFLPAMAMGGLMGRLVANSIQAFAIRFPGVIPVAPESYSMVAAGATMCGTTRLSMTVVVILVELTGSLDHMLPFCGAILAAKWAASKLERQSIYDTCLASYPFLNAHSPTIPDAELCDVLAWAARPWEMHVADTRVVSVVDAEKIHRQVVQADGPDRCIPIVRNGGLLGVIAGSDLGRALQCASGVGCNGVETIDLTPYIDPNIVAMDSHSSAGLVHQSFVRLGQQCVGVLRRGQYAGLLHRRDFVEFLRRRR